MEGCGVMEKEQALLFAVNMIRNIDYAERFSSMEDQSMIGLKNCLICLVSNIKTDMLIENIKEKNK